MRAAQRGLFFFTLLFLSIAPSFPQESKPVRVSSGDVLTQLNVLIIVDKTVGKPEKETLALVKDVIQLNQAQIDYIDVTTDASSAGLAALAKGDTISAFRNMRKAICGQRPHLTQLIDLDGKLRSCEQPNP